MTTSDLRFGVVAGRASSGAAWADTARRVEALGYDLLLTPDTAYTASPFPALAAAAAVTTRVRLGTWVAPAMLRPIGALMRETAALQQLSDDRFELGLGTGRPDAEQEALRFGGGWGSPAERLARLVEAVGAARALDPAPGITVAALGPRALATAGRIADTVALALPPTATTDDVRAAADRARSGGDPALALQLSAVGGAWVGYLARNPPPSDGVAAFLAGDAAAMAEQVTALVAATGVTTFPVAEEHAEAFAPVIVLLRGGAAGGAMLAG